MVPGIAASLGCCLVPEAVWQACRSGNLTNPGGEGSGRRGPAEGGVGVPAGGVQGVCKLAHGAKWLESLKWTVCTGLWLMGVGVRGGVMPRMPVRVAWKGHG